MMTDCNGGRTFLSAIQWWVGVESPRGTAPPEVLTDPDVNLSAHPALVIVMMFLPLLLVDT